jgi:hypothetical protein
MTLDHTVSQMRYRCARGLREASSRHIDAHEIFIEQGKSDKDRYILFPESFHLALKPYLATVPENEYPFEFPA